MDFLIMNRDSIAAEYIDGRLKIINKNITPLQLIFSDDVDKWLETRAIDSHRANSRLLKKALRLTDKDDIGTVISVNAATITDTYWIKPLGSDLTYGDVRFDNDYFSNLALTGSYDSFNKAANSKRSRTPELTNIGSYEKCWKLRDGDWWMYKKANHEEMFSELFVYKLGMRLGFNMAHYERGRGVIKTKDFTDNATVNFESAYSFMGDNEDYIDTVKKLKKLCHDCIGDYVRIIFLDTICANPDRHTFNFGVLRNSENGKIIGLAPNFDNNMALIARGYPKNIARKNDVLVRLFNELMQYDKTLKQYVPTVTDDIIKTTIDELSMRVKSKVITEFMMNGYNQIKQ